MKSLISGITLAAAMTSSAIAAEPMPRTFDHPGNPDYTCVTWYLGFKAIDCVLKKDANSKTLEKRVQELEQTVEKLLSDKRAKRPAELILKKE